MLAKEGMTETRPYVRALIELAQERPNLVCLVGDLAKSTEIDTFQDAFPDRFFDLGMTEQNIMSIAGGMARSGDLPFVHTFGVFATRRPYDQVAMSIAYPRLDVKIVGFLPGLTTPGGVTHQAIDDLALMRALPNVAVYDPVDAVELRQIVRVAAEHPGPVYIRGLRGQVPVLFDEREYRPSIGKAAWVREGDDATIISAGVMTIEALQAADDLAAVGLRVGVLHSPSVKPLDEASIVAAARATGIVVTAENHSIIGGLGSAVAETLLENGVTVSFARVGVRDTYAEGGSPAYLFDKYGLSARHIAATVQRLCRPEAGNDALSAGLEREISGSKGV
jgi:transketolase